MKILKFGGSSVATPNRIKSVVEIIKTQLDKEQIAVVFSAFGGVTDTLIQLTRLALQGNSSYVDVLTQLEERHRDAVNELSIPNEEEVRDRVDAKLSELKDVLHGIYLVKECSPRTLDFVMSFGERLSAYIISEALKACDLSCEYLDARNVIRTNDQFGNARVDFESTNALLQEYFASHNMMQVVTGFIASATNGETTTLGRSGSDYTAAILAGALHATSLEIWTDVDGMMTADPRKVSKAFTVAEMTYEEAMELSHFGARVIFPATMQPAMVNNIQIYIKNTFNPAFAGTRISAENGNGVLTIKGISSMSNLSLLNVEGAGLQGVVGVAMRLFSALARADVNVILISQASSEHSICLAVHAADADRACSAIESEFAFEIQTQRMRRVEIEGSMAVIAIVGEKMKHNPGTSGRMFQALGKNGINVNAIAQGSSELNISAVIAEADAAKALNVLHEAFFLSDRKTVHLYLVGTGLIGKQLVKMVDEQYAQLADSHLLEIKLVGIADSKRMLFNEAGFVLHEADDLKNTTGVPMHMRHFVDSMKQQNLSNSIFVDCTASDEITGYYEEILSSNIAIVTPNKRANSGPWHRYQRLKKIALQRGVRYLYETNVGAGLPVINTLNDLILSGDRVKRIEAVLSGTMNFIFTSFEGSGVPFSRVVKEAKQLGYTEPDPRDDLSGVDVARKILILAREAGISLELEDVTINGLVPDDCKAVAEVERFFDLLASHDQHFERLRANAESAGKKLRYSALLEDGKATVALTQVDTQHPFYALKGSDNIILLTTERYHDQPMIIRGPGAGASVTAAGVFADIIRIGHYAMR